MFEQLTLGGLAEAVELERVLSHVQVGLERHLSPAFREPRGASQFAAVQRLRERRRMPRYVALADGDNELVADLDNVLCLEALAHEVRGRTSASFVEISDSL